MKRAIGWLYRSLTGKSEQELAAAWQRHHFVTRSRIKAYWLTLVA